MHSAARARAALSSMRMRGCGIRGFLYKFAKLNHNGRVNIEPPQFSVMCGTESGGARVGFTLAEPAEPRQLRASTPRPCCNAKLKIWNETAVPFCPRLTSFRQLPTTPLALFSSTHPGWWVRPWLTKTPELPLKYVVQPDFPPGAQLRQGSQCRIRQMTDT